MKNITPLITPDEIRKYVYDLWQTEEFRNAQQNPNSLVGKTVDRFTRLPRLFADMSDDKLETPHFSSWWNVLSRRYNYDNPVIHDLYNLHEYIHAGSLAHIPDITFNAFQLKMNANELDTSLATEVLVYFDMPELRENSFEYNIYADRFLDDRAFRHFWNNDQEAAIAYLRECRRAVMFSDHPKDQIEAAIHLYASQNTQWQMVWETSYGAVENAMGQFKEIAHSGRGRAAALQNLIAWLQNPSHTLGTDIPFHAEANRFSSIYWDNKKYYGEMVASLTRQHLRPMLAPASLKEPSAA